MTAFLIGSACSLATSSCLAPQWSISAAFAEQRASDCCASCSWKASYSLLLPLTGQAWLVRCLSQTHWTEYLQDESTRCVASMEESFGC